METLEGKLYTIEQALKLALGNTTGHTQNQVRKALLEVTLIKKSIKPVEDE